jgi:hypothetical protein
MIHRSITRKHLFRKTVIGLSALLLAIQLVQPERNLSSGASPNDISYAYQMPVEVHEILTQKCYDCHSNNTRYPWYIYIQPVGWWMAAHIKEGKEHLNFSEFKTYSTKKANDKLEELSEAVTEGWMPLESYVWMHRDTKITPEDSQKINTWIQSLGISLEEEDE